MSNWGYIVAAYVLTWVVLGGYAIYLRRRSRRARERLEQAPDSGAQGGEVRV